MRWPGENEWGDFQWLKAEALKFRQELIGGWYASAGQHRLKLRMNNFPDEPLWTLFADGRQVTHFDEAPSAWSIPIATKDRQ